MHPAAMPVPERDTSYCSLSKQTRCTLSSRTDNCQWPAVARTDTGPPEAGGPLAGSPSPPLQFFILFPSSSHALTHSQLASVSITTGTAELDAAMRELRNDDLPSHQANRIVCILYVFYNLIQ